MASRRLIHKLMRLAFQEDAVCLVEDLKPVRAHISASMAQALADSEERTGRAVF